MSKFKVHVLFVVLLLSLSMILVACGDSEGDNETNAGDVQLHVVAKNWSLESDVQEIPKGSSVVVTLENQEGYHSILIEGYDIVIEAGKSQTFTADEVGEFIIRCNTICGPIEEHENQTMSFVVVE